MNASSDFTGSEDPLSEGGVWTNAGVGMRKTSGFAQTASANHGFAGYTTGTWANDQYSQLVRNGSAFTISDQYVTACVRMSSFGSIQGYGLAAITNTDYRMFKMASGTWDSVTLHTYAVTPALGDTIKLVVEGTTLTGYVNGTPLSPSVTDASFATGVPGMHHYSPFSIDVIDSWEGSDVSTVRRIILSSPA